MNWHTVEAKAVRHGQPDRLRRLVTPFSSVPPARLPNGLARPEGVKIVVAFRLGGDYHFLARLVRDSRLGTLLQIEAEAFDVQRRRRVRLDMTPELLAQVYGVLEQRYLSERMRDYGRTVGRN